jgi:integrase/recombinase XerC
MQTPDIVSQFLSDLEAEGVSPNTVKAYGQDLRAWAKWYDQTTGGQALTAADPRDIRDYQGDMVRKGLKPATINRRLNAMRRFYRWAVRKGLASDTPFDGLKVGVKVQKQTAPKWLTEKEQRRLLRSVRACGKKNAVRDMAIIRLGLDAGLRLSEIVDLTLNDVEPSGRSAWVRVRFGKGGKARELPLSLEARKALAAWLDERENHPYADDPHLFLGQRGPLSGAGIYRIVTKYGRMADIEGLTPHTLRHTFAKNLIDAGRPLTVVAALMGHESLDTLAIYTRPSREDLQRAISGHW